MTRGELKSRMSAREFSEWVAYYQHQHVSSKRRDALLQGAKMHNFFAALKAKQNAKGQRQD